MERKRIQGRAGQRAAFVAHLKKPQGNTMGKSYEVVVHAQCQQCKQAYSVIGIKTRD